MFQPGDETADLFVGMFEKACVRRHESRVDGPLFLREVGPCGITGISRRELRVRRNNAELELLPVALLADRVPSPACIRPAPAPSTCGAWSRMPAWHEDVPAVPARARLLLHQQRQGGLQPREARRGLGRVLQARRTGGTAGRASRSSPSSTSRSTPREPDPQRPTPRVHDPAKVRVPAYHPDTPEVRHDWAQYYDKITAMDAQVRRGWRNSRRPAWPRTPSSSSTATTAPACRAANAGPTTPACTSRSFACSPRSSGTWRRRTTPRRHERTPGRLRRPGADAAEPGGHRAAGVDAGARLPGPHEAPPRTYLFGFRGRMDERYDMVRSVRDQRYVYIRNYMPHLIYGQHIDYMFQTPTTRGLEAALRRRQAQAAADLLLGAQAARGALRPADRPRTRSTTWPPPPSTRPCWSVSARRTARTRWRSKT